MQRVLLRLGSVALFVIYATTVYLVVITIIQPFDNKDYLMGPTVLVVMLLLLPGVRVLQRVDRATRRKEWNESL
ncbi:MAG: hypothetical protein IPK19_35380 [Chloroflexi bacterium]|nr:hypothetical protein [Chloroflexota bacterium]